MIWELCTSPATTRLQMPLMRTVAQLTWTPPTSTSRLVCSCSRANSLARTRAMPRPRNRRMSIPRPIKLQVLEDLRLPNGGHQRPPADRLLRHRHPPDRLRIGTVASTSSSLRPRLKLRARTAMTSVIRLARRLFSSRAQDKSPVERSQRPSVSSQVLGLRSLLSCPDQELTRHPMRFLRLPTLLRRLMIALTAVLLLLALLLVVHCPPLQLDPQLPPVRPMGLRLLVVLSLPSTVRSLLPPKFGRSVRSDPRRLVPPIRTSNSTMALACLLCRALAPLVLLVVHLLQRLPSPLPKPLLASGRIGLAPL